MIDRPIDDAAREVPEEHRRRFSSRRADGRMQCEVCPRACALRPGQRGFCFVREGTDDDVTLNSYGRASGFCIDPIEKKPLFHFYPGSSVLSFGTAGCNLGCKFCQNWEISKAKSTSLLDQTASPRDIVDAALAHDARSIAFTYNDPVIFLEYAIDTAREARARGVHPVAVTAGYITALARAPFFDVMDAVNVDLKAFTESFYRDQCLGALEPVKDTLRHIAHETDTWLEVTTLLIPGLNDSDDELHALSAFMADDVGTHVPLHFSAFHPDHRLTHIERTPADTLRRARAIAKSHGLDFVYVGNVHDADGQNTRCPTCAASLIERDWYEVGDVRVRGGACPNCHATIAGHFDDDDDRAPRSRFGRRRQPLRILPAR